MVQRPVPLARCPGRGGWRRPGIPGRASIASRSGSPSARFAAIADASVQPVPWVCRVSIRGRLISNALGGRADDVDRVRAVQVAALDAVRRGGPCRGSARPPRACPSSVRMVIPASTSASGTFGVTTCARGSSSARIAATASSSSSASPPLAIITGSTTTCGSSSASIAAATASTIAAVREHAGLHRIGADVADDRFDLRGDEVRGHRQPGDDAERVLRRHRGHGARCRTRRAPQRSAGRPGCRRRRPSRCRRLS